ncbi:hypothetical protein CLOSBL3_11806 [Clostridiaceae bacterium BL-3]|nr:hypothetical protein CLOSBL3_11806 [Clostridiaceae bacterium BL-3]
MFLTTARFEASSWFLNLEYLSFAITFSYKNKENIPTSISNIKNKGTNWTDPFFLAIFIIIFSPSF